MENKEKKVATIFDYSRFINQCKASKCKICPMSLINNGQNYTCKELLQYKPEIYNKLLLKWCEEHPVKTFKDDFLEKFPDAWLTEHTPKACRHNIYPYNRGDHEICTEMDCAKCWNEPYQE